MSIGRDTSSPLASTSTACAVLNMQERAPEHRVTTIYAICEDETQAIRYIGKTVGKPTQRFRSHLLNSKKSNQPSAKWIREQIAAGKVPVLVELERVSTGKDWADRECFWIEKYRNEGADLLNVTNGGEGLSGAKFTPEHRQRIRVALMRGAQFFCEQCSGQFWRKPCDIKLGNARFCSRNCYHLSTRGIFRAIPKEVTARGVKAAAALRKAKPDCQRGHPLFGENLRIRDGRRSCRKCARIAELKYRAKRT